MTRALQYGNQPDRTAQRQRRAEAVQRRNEGYFERSKPSAPHNKPKHRMSIPPGCTDIYRVSQWDGCTSRYHGIYYSEAEAYEKADKVWEAAIKSDRVKVTVEHKAAIGLGGKLYLANTATRSLMSKTRTGRQQSEEHNKAISAGRLVSSRVALAASRQRKAMVLDGVHYDSCDQAAHALGVCKATIYYRFNHNWSNYSYA